MSYNKNSFPDWFLRLTTEMLNQQNETLREAARWWQQGLQDNASAWMGPSKSYLDFIGPEASAFLKQWWSLSQDYYRDLSELNGEFARRIMDEARYPASPRPAHSVSQEPAEEAETRVIPLTISGPVGKTVEKNLVLENLQNRTADLAFLVSDVVNDKGGESFRPSFSIEPARFSLTPGQEQSVAVRLLLDEKLFSANETYRATVLVNGYPGLSLAIRIAPTPPEKPAPKKRPAAKKPAKTTGSTRQRRSTSTEKTTRSRSSVSKSKSEGKG